MKYLPLPPQAWFMTRYALVVEEATVAFVSWKRGTFRKIAQFANDTQGQSEFSDFMKKKGLNYSGKNINICVSLVGEDYRFEKTAHLSGKYKSDMVKRKCEQLFRGAQYFTHQSQGREEIGRRLDMILFCGVLSNEKLQPWVRIVQRHEMHIAGVHSLSLLSCSLFSQLVPKKEGIKVISFVADEGTARHNFFVDGHLRFSRIGRLGGSGQNAEEIMRSVRGEIDKTAQYLSSIKLVKQGAPIEVYFVCSDDFHTSLQQLAAVSEGERIRVISVSASQLSQKVGIKRPISEYGRDSSVIVHQMLRSVFSPLDSLAPVNTVAFSFMRNVVFIGCLVVAGWAGSGILQSGFRMLNGFFSFASENVNLAAEVASERNEYNRLREQFQTPPSSLKNMEAAVNLLDNSLVERINPGKMMRFVGGLLSDNQFLDVQTFDWFLANDPSGQPAPLAFATGLGVYQVADLQGEVFEDTNPELAVELFREMVEQIESRPDMSVIIIAEPELVETGGRLSGELEQATNVHNILNDFSSRAFNFRIIWNTDYGREQG